MSRQLAQCVFALEAARRRAEREAHIAAAVIKKIYIEFLFFDLFYYYYYYFDVATNRSGEAEEDKGALRREKRHFSFVGPPAPGSTCMDAETPLDAHRRR